MTIKQLLAMPIGSKVGGGFVLTIKTAKKKWRVKDKWFQQVLLTDETGDMLADVKIGTYRPLIASLPIKIIVAERRETDLRNKQVPLLCIDQFSLPTQTADEAFGMNIEESEAVIDGKIRCHLVSAYIASGREPDQSSIKYWTEYIKTGK